MVVSESDISIDFAEFVMEVRDDAEMSGLAQQKTGQATDKKKDVESSKKRSRDERSHSADQSQEINDNFRSADKESLVNRRISRSQYADIPKMPTQSDERPKVLILSDNIEFMSLVLNHLARYSAQVKLLTDPKSAVD